MADLTSQPPAPEPQARRGHNGPVNVLLVEDNPGDARLAREFLSEGTSSLQAEVRWESTLEDALGALDEGGTDIVLLDLSLPDSAGLETFTTIHNRARHLPIIILSGQADEDLAIEMVKQGAQDHLSKNSLDADLIARSIRYGIERKAVLEQLRQTQMQLIQAEKLESIGRLAAGVAHEVKNPLARIQLGLDYLKDGIKPDDENLPLIFERMEGAVRRADAIICEMVNFSSDRQLDFKVRPIRDVVANALILVDHEIKKRGIHTEMEIPEDLPDVRIDNAKLEQVLINLMLNAIQAMDENGDSTKSLTVSAFPSTVAEAQGARADRTGRGLRTDEEVVVLNIDDTGPGIPEDKAENIFDPFVTTKPTGVGTGLGLTVARKIIDLHDGVLTLQNREDGTGARAQITLRAYPSSSQNPSATDAVKNDPSEKGDNRL